MKVVLAFLAIIVVAANASPNRNVVPVLEALRLSPRIISGKPAELGDFPWQASNKFQTFMGTSFCGGALVNKRWVLTAGHCAQGALSFEITLGSIYSASRTETKSVKITTTKAIVHPDYNSFYITNDLALIDLQTDVGLTDNIKVIPLGTDFIPSGVKLTVSGWGKTSDASTSVSPVLNFVELTTISNQECKDVYGSSITEGSLCCRGAPEHSTCNGDSGGPLVQYNGNGEASHAGVVSFVHINGCASGQPSGYARTQFYKDWINGIISA